MTQKNKFSYQLVNPRNQATPTSFNFAPRLLDLKGKKLGLIDDNKTNAKEILDDLSKLLKDRFDIIVSQYHRKPSASKPADPEVVDSMANNCDAVIIAIGD